MPKHTVFTKENADIWGAVYGTPSAIAAILFGVSAVTGEWGWAAGGCFLLSGVIGSYLLISLVEAIS